MKRKNKISLVFLFMTLSCAVSMPKGKSNLAFISYLSRLNNLITNASSSTASPKIVSTDFSHISTISPVIISKTQTLGITFDTQMDPNGCSIQINGSGVAANVTTSSDKLTLFFQPSSTWQVDVLDGIILNLSANCKSIGGFAYVPGTGTSLYVSDLLVYADSSVGNDNNPGTIQSPFKTLSAAITALSASCAIGISCTVAMKGGTYPITTSITMPTNISLFGGFDPNDWTKRRSGNTNLPPYDTIISDTSSNVVSGGASNPYSSIYYFNYIGVKEKSILDGVIVQGPTTAITGNYVTAIGIVNLSSGGGVTIRNTIAIDQSTSINITSSGLEIINIAGTVNVNNSSFSGSSVSAATSTRKGIGIGNSQINSITNLSNNSIDSGIATSANFGIQMSGTNNGMTSALQNKINVGNCSTCIATGVAANFATASGLTLSQNTITVGSGTDSIGINHTSGAGLAMSKNIITTGTGTNSSKGYASSGVATLTADSNTITTGTGGTNGSIGIFFNTAGTHSSSNNIITTGDCNVATCETTGIILNATATSLTMDKNTIQAGNCTTTNCASKGIDLKFNTPTVSLTNSTVKSGNCSGSPCTTTGLRMSTNGSINLTASDDIISSGTCSIASCFTMGVEKLGSGSVTFNFIRSSILAGTCSASSCSSIGINHNGSASGNSTYNINTNSTVSGGDCVGTGCVSYGVNVPSNINANTYNFSNSTFSTGSADASTAGIISSNNNATHNYVSNTISSGSCIAASCTTYGMNMSFGTNYSYTYNTIVAGTCNGTTCAQVGLRQAANASTVTINDNTIDSGITSANTSKRYALSLSDWPGAGASVQRNTFINRPGAANSTTLLLADSSGISFTTSRANKLTICSNVIIGGDNSDATDSYLIEIGNASNVNNAIIGNTFIAGSVTTGISAIVKFNNAGAKLVNFDMNLFSGNVSSTANTRCVWESVAGISYNSLVKNNFINCTNLYNKNAASFNLLNGVPGPVWNGTTNVTGITTNMGNMNYTTNFINASSQNYRLDTGTTNAAVTQGYNSLSDQTQFNTACGNLLDRDGMTRTYTGPASSIGAYK